MTHTYLGIPFQDNQELSPVDDLIARIESKEGGLTTINLENIPDITPQQLSQLFKAISKNKQIISLNITGININQTAAKELSVLPIGHLIAVNCQLDDNAITLISQNRSITHLDISCNNFGEKGVAALAKNTCLKELIARSNHLGRASKSLLSALQYLILIDLSMNQITDADVTTLECSTTLKTLILNGNLITEIGAIALIQHNDNDKHCLEELGLRNNQIASKDEIEKSLTKTTVYLWHNSNNLSCAVSPSSKPATGLVC